MSNCLEHHQKLLLQCLMTTAHLSEVEMQDLIKKCCVASQVAYQPSHISNWTNKINDVLDMYGLCIKKGLNHVTGDTVYALVNTAEDEFAKLATSFSARELAFIRKCISLVVENEFEVSEGELLREARFLGNEGKDLNSKEAETVLNTLCEDGWLIRTQRDGIILSPRLILELEQYLEESYEGLVLKCARCERIVTKGYRCSNDECFNCWHYKCEASADQKCFGCNSAIRKTREGRGMSARRSKAVEPMVVDEVIEATQ